MLQVSGKSAHPHLLALPDFLCQWHLNSGQRSWRFNWLILLFLKSLREVQFSLCTGSVQDLLPRFFGLDKVNYAWWLTVHLRDMIQLGKTCPSVKQKFKEGSFVLRKTQRPWQWTMLMSKTTSLLKASVTKQFTNMRNWFNSDKVDNVRRHF